MKTKFIVTALGLCSSLLCAADLAPNQVLLNAAKDLAAKPNYRFVTTVEVPGDPQGTIDGKVEKKGPVVLTLSRGDESYGGVLRGGKGALKADGTWLSLSEANDPVGGQSGATRFVAQLLESFKTPDAEVAELATKVKDLKVKEGVIGGALTEESATELLFYRTRRSSNGPTFSKPKGSIQFWIKDGALTKYEYILDGTLMFNGDERQIQRTHTTVIRDVGTTKVVVPEAAEKKL